MGRAASPSAGRRYGLARVCRVLEIPRSTVYAARARRLAPVPPRKRGPKTAWTDAELTEQIRGVLAALAVRRRGLPQGLGAAAPGRGPGRQAARAPADARGRTCWPRPGRGQPHGPAAHDGTIIPDRPDAMWGIDATAAWTDEGPATVFIAVDHFTAECVGIHAARRGHPLRGPRAAPPGHPPALRRLPRGRRGRPGAPPRPRQPVHERPLPDRAALPGDRQQPGLRPRARGQRVRRALHPHPQRTAPLDRALRLRRSPAPGAPRLQGPLQPRVAHRAPRPPDASGRPGRVRCRRGSLITISPVSRKSGAVQPRQSEPKADAPESYRAIPIHHRPPDVSRQSAARSRRLPPTTD